MEHPAHNRTVLGSSPSGSMTRSSMDEDMPLHGEYHISFDVLRGGESNQRDSVRFRAGPSMNQTIEVV